MFKFIYVKSFHGGIKLNTHNQVFDFEPTVLVDYWSLFDTDKECSALVVLEEIDYGKFILWERLINGVTLFINIKYADRVTFLCSFNIPGGTEI